MDSIDTLKGVGSELLSDYSGGVSDILGFLAQKGKPEKGLSLLGKNPQNMLICHDQKIEFCYLVPQSIAIHYSFQEQLS